MEVERRVEINMEGQMDMTLDPTHRWRQKAGSSTTQRNNCIHTATVSKWQSLAPHVCADEESCTSQSIHHSGVHPTAL